MSKSKVTSLMIHHCRSQITCLSKHFSFVFHDHFDSSVPYRTHVTKERVDIFILSVVGKLHASVF